MPTHDPAPHDSEPRWLDHVVVACPDLEETVGRVAEATGVTPVPGGVHPRFGTRNHLVAFGADTYLELIGVDQENTTVGSGRPFGLDTLTETRVSTWAIHPLAPERAASAAREAGCDVGVLAPGSRRTLDGELLEWRLTPDHAEPSGIVPFLIDWGSSTSPGRSVPVRLGLVALSASHPEPSRLAAVLTALGTGLRISAGPAALNLTIEGPAGRLTL